MPSIKLSVPHPLSREEASERLKKFAHVVRERYKDKVKNVHEEWSEQGITFGFTTMGFEIKGNIAVEDNNADVRTDLPFAAMMFKGRIEQEIRDAITKALA